MESISVVQAEAQRRALVTGLARRERVRELAGFLGLDSEAIAEGLLEAVERDPALRRVAHVHRAA